ncbi:membrane-associated phospholipid phosphatase [Fontibacillus solani]|uniref:Membrane-associated phospholipid phosphatase n=1 Tax=Fontibacillus solani TaxID=1572857 RepID=A0A7W3SVX7_9BACL|nr:inositol phosphorylceramide synthase [Fontibacillus solani]MBA9087174.1 membrane-associated phospholipid phosphatase [Fontibacillus solani]
MMNAKLRAYTPLLWILVIPVLNLFYGPLNHGEGIVSSLMTDLDKQIPFVPVFIIPYLLWYPFIIIMLIAFFLSNKRAYYLILLTQCLGLISCYLVYALFQTTVSRPSILEYGILYKLVAFVYNTDQPFNCFPSIHVLTSYLMIRGVSLCPKLSKLFRVVVYTCSWSIICSTLFVKQHVLLDIAGAIALVEILWFVLIRLSPFKQTILLKGVNQGEKSEHFGR